MSDAAPPQLIAFLLTARTKQKLRAPTHRWVYSGTLGAISVASIMGVGIAFKIDFFMHTDISLAFAILMLFVGAMIAYAFVLASVIPSTFMAMMWVSPLLFEVLSRRWETRSHPPPFPLFSLPPPAAPSTPTALPPCTASSE